MVGPDDDEVRFLASGSLALLLYNHHRVDEARPYLALAEELAPRVNDAFRQGWWSITGSKRASRTWRSRATPDSTSATA